MPTAATVWGQLESRADAETSSVLIATRQEQVSAAALADRAERLAGGLVALGLSPGDRIAVIADNRFEHVELAFAANRLGASYAPVNPLFKGDLLHNALTTIEPTVVVIDAVCRAAIEPYRDLVSRWVVLDEGIAEGLPGDIASYTEVSAHRPPSTAAPGERRESMVLFTSGTTGPSKAISMADEFLLNVAKRNARAREITPEDRLHSCYAFCHANPIGYTLLPAMVAGATMAWTPRFSASEFWRDLRDLEATHFTAFGPVMLMLLAQPESKLDLSHGAGVCMGIGTPRKSGFEFEERFGVRIVEPYGLSECGAITYQWREARRLGSVGKATPGWRVEVVDDEDELLAPGEVGEIVARPLEPGLLMDGYIGRPEATLEVYRNLWFHTGDRGYFDEDGFLWFVDRKKDAIRRRGENISSFEVEETVLSTGLVEECAAFPVPSELGEDEVMVAVIPSVPELDPGKLREVLEERLPVYALPRFVRIVDELPRTPTGKIEKYKLREVGVTPATWEHVTTTSAGPRS